MDREGFRAVQLYEVDMEVGGDREGYWAVMRFEDRKGKLHKKEIRRERKADKNGNVLQAAVEAFEALKVPCEVRLFTDCTYLLNPLRQGWLARWEAAGWKNADGKQVQNAGQWRRLCAAMAWHGVTHCTRGAE